jgi:hypothetical protein
MLKNQNFDFDLKLDDTIKFQVKDKILKLSEFRYNCIGSNLIYLKRIKPLHCKKCDRIHEHQNSILLSKRKVQYIISNFIVIEIYIVHSLKFQMMNLMKNLLINLLINSLIKIVSII